MKLDRSKRPGASFTPRKPGIAKAISADTPRARELRQTSPFAGALNEHERKLLVEAVERRASVA